MSFETHVIEPSSGPPPDLQGALPLRVRAYMASAIVGYGEPIHLDGILAYAAFREWSKQNDPASLPHIREEWAVDFRLPLQAWASAVPEQPPYTFHEGLCAAVQGDDAPKVIWGWAATRETAEWLHHGGRELRKTPDLDTHKRWGTAPSVNIGSGTSKAKNVVVPSRFALHLDWYCLGLESVVRQWLNEHVTHLGRLKNHGCGQVLRWTVTPEAQAPPSSVLARPLVRGSSVRPPYHHPSRRLW